MIKSKFNLKIQEKKILKKYKKAFSFVEVMIALFFISILSVAIFNLFNIATLTEKKSQSFFKGFNLASETMESLIILPFDEIKPNNKKIGIFDVRWQIKETDGIKDIILFVKWKEASKERHIKLERSKTFE